MAYGLACAATAGLGAEVVTRAGEVMMVEGGGRGGSHNLLLPLPAAVAAAGTVRARAAGLAARLAALATGEEEGGLSDEAKALLLAAVR